MSEVSDPAATSIIFIFTSLLIGVLVSQILAYFNNAIPFTVVIFIFGALMAFFDYQYFGLWSVSIADWSDFNSELIFYFLLPPLILGEAMYVNWYYAVGGMSQSILLAGPGVVIGTFLMGVLTKYVLPYSWSWNFCFLFGAILSATDPVAVVSLLKGCDASPKLTILIIGESILNDGTAMVMFTLLFNMLNGKTYTIGDIALYLVNSCLGSMSFGIACGLGMVYWMRTLTNQYKELDSILQIIITVACGYLIFFVAQNSLAQSGVLALCGTGIVLAALAPPIVLNQGAMHDVWETLCWFMNTILFLVVGLRLGNQLMKTATAIDYFLVFALYLLLMLCRVVIITLFYPILSRTGHKCTINEAIFIAWSGLRGGVAMVLALLVGTNTNSEISSDENNRFFFFVGGVTALTLLINGTLAETLLLRLGLIGDLKIEKLAIANHLRRQVYKQIDEYCEALQNDHSKIYVQSRCSVLKPSPNPHHHSRSHSRPTSGHKSTFESLYEKRRFATLNPSTPRSALDDGTEAETTTYTETNKTVGENEEEYEEIKESLQAVIEEDYEEEEEEEEEEDDDDDESNNDTAEVETNLNQPLLVKVHSGRSKSSASTSRAARNIDVHNPNPAQRTKSCTIIPFDDSVALDIDHVKSNHHHHYAKSQTQTQTQQPQKEEGSDVKGLASESSDSFSSSESGHDSTPFEKRKKSVTSLLTRRMLARGDRQSLMTDSGGMKLSYYRTIFLSIVRAKYRAYIQEGTLPRYSHCALFLLYSIDVGLDLVHFSTPGLQDWATLVQELEKEQPLAWALYVVGRRLNSRQILIYLLRLEARKIKRAVYLLTSFIAAHQYAQSKLHEYSVSDDDFYIHPASADQENKVLAESKIAVSILAYINTYISI